jgi:hypothetical protein
MDKARLHGSVPRLVPCCDIGGKMNCAIAAIGLHVVSLHLPERHFQDITPGVYIRTDCNIEIGAFRNSVDNMAVYAAYAIDGKETDGPLLSHMWAAAGITTGYPRHNPHLRPLFIAGLKADVGDMTFRLGYIPRGLASSHTFHLMIEKAF